MQPTPAQVEPDVLHAQAVQTLLAAAGFGVYLGEDEIPDQPDFPYLVAWAVPGDPCGPERLTGYDGSIITRHQLTAAALASLDVIGTLARARNLLHRQRPTIPGRRCGDLDHMPGSQTVPRVDPTVRGPHGQRIYVAYASYTLTSTLM